MKKLLILILFLGLSAANAFAAGPAAFNPAVLAPADSSDQPDMFGYTWVDSDNGGSPDFNWIDITDIGVQVENLADDNVVGPFDIGFDLPYYWYDVNSFYVGSNGYISFSSNAIYTQSFDQIPDRNLPNDLVAPLACDLDFTSIFGTNECYFYSNNQDTLIVSWIDVAEWREHPAPNTEHTFQVIFCATDSSITFQYGPQEGNFQNPNGASSIGIEDLIGRSGLNYLHDLTPSNRVPHQNLVIRIHADPDPDFEFSDAGISGVMNLTSGGIFTRLNEPLTIGTYVRNTGVNALDDLRVNCIIKRSFMTQYNDTVNISHLDPGEITYVEFPVLYSPDEFDVYSIISRTLTQDDFSPNNTDTCEMRIFDGSGYQMLTYADTSTFYYAWLEGVGLANEFEIPTSMPGISITGMAVELASDGTPSYWYIVGADEDGNPDLSSVLWADTIATIDTGWVSLPVSDVEISNGEEKFFAMVVLGGDGCAIGMDQFWPYSHRGWEYTGTFAPFRDGDEQDICIRVVAEGTNGIDDGLEIPSKVTLHQNYPNPFNASTMINYELPEESQVTINIYDILGRKVTTLEDSRQPAGNHQLIWNADRFSSGTYFYKLTAGDFIETKKIMLVK